MLFTIGQILLQIKSFWYVHVWNPLIVCYREWTISVLLASCCLISSHLFAGKLYLLTVIDMPWILFPNDYYKRILLFLLLKYSYASQLKISMPKLIQLKNLVYEHHFLLWYLKSITVVCRLCFRNDLRVIFCYLHRISGTQRVGFLSLVGSALTALYMYHIYFLAFVHFDYGYNMMVNLIVGEFWHSVA